MNLRHGCARRRRIALAHLTAWCLFWLPGAFPPAPGAGVPRRVPSPEPPPIERLQDLRLTTVLARDGRPACAIVAPASGLHAAAARALQRAIRERSGAEPPLLDDRAPDKALRPDTNLILLGNRSDNRVLEDLYNRYFALTDLRFPGPGGCEVRTVHDPFGTGHNVVIAGGSDEPGVQAAADILAARVREAPVRAGDLALGWVLEVRLGRGLALSRDVRALEVWEASKGYGSTGYFGWNSISKRLAAYAMSGDTFHAREAIRLAFRERGTFAEIAEIDQERIEDKSDPLAGPYHYNAHLMILFWDLVEESPVFSDEERLRVTRAFARQLRHRLAEGIYPLTTPPRCVGSRHGQWSAISLYCLGRYFQRDYPHPVWEQCVRAARLHFAPLHHHAWVSGENDNLFWYNTAIAPVFTYLLLSGERAPLHNGVLATLLRAHETLISGRVPDWALNSAAIDFLHKAAYLTSDGRWLTYRDRTGLDLTPLRLGQSFWPDPTLKPAPPADLVGTWSVTHLPEPHRAARATGFSADESFANASFRSAADATGDFVLVDGLDGMSRNPHHSFALLELRIAGQTLLQGYHNQLLTRIDGMVNPRVATDAALRRRGVIGGTAFCVAEVPSASHGPWRRTIAQRVGRHALFIDDLHFARGGGLAQIQILWANPQHPFHPAPAGLLRTRAPDATITTADPPDRLSRAGGLCTIEWTGPIPADSTRHIFSLVAPGTDARCARLSDCAAALALPGGPAVAVRGEWNGICGDTVVLSDRHLFALDLAGISTPVPLAEADTPVDLEWDFDTGRIEIAARAPATVTLCAPAPDTWRVRGAADGASRTDDGRGAVSIPAGHVTIESPPLDPDIRRALLAALDSWLKPAIERRETAPPPPVPDPALPPLALKIESRLDGPVASLLVFSIDGRNRAAAASGRVIRLCPLGHGAARDLGTEGDVRVLHWWASAGLLLAGCNDEKVIAFRPDDRARRWTFTSEMDPAVFRAAKQYWFKSAPGHGGIHGLGSGRFLEGEEQAFVGSACTLEILGPDGRLKRRLPQFWGPVHLFALVPGPGATVNLLASRDITDAPNLAIVNSRTLDPSVRGFDSAPAGTTPVRGWMNQTRRHLIHADLDGDGKREIAGDIVGAWNRVGIWDEQGRPLANASFGPGDPAAATPHIRALATGDLDGDGRIEIVVALDDALLVALDHRCARRWIRRLPSPARTLAIVDRTLAAGLDDGRVRTLDAKGASLREARVQGRPTVIAATGDPPTFVIGTDEGLVASFNP